MIVRASAAAMACLVMTGACSLTVPLDDLQGGDAQAFASSGVGATGAGTQASTSSAGAGAAGGSPSSTSTSTGAGGGSSNQYAASVMADGPIAYYRLGDAAPPIAVDASGHGHDATYMRGVALGAQGALVGDTDTAAHFDGSNDNIDAGDGVFDFAGTAAFTLEAWVLPDTVDVEYQAIFSKEDDGPAGRQGYFLSLNYATLRFIRNANGAWDLSAGGALAAGVFSHVAVTFDGFTMLLYLNGLEVAGGSADKAMIDNGQPLFIGERTLYGGIDSLLGTIDEVALYDKALPATKLNEHIAAAVR